MRTVYHLKTSKLKIVILLLFLLFIYIYLYFSSKFNFVLPCPIKRILNVYCPGCGITRMFISLFHGKIYQAFRYNMLVFSLMTCYIIYLVIKIKFKINLNHKTKLILLTFILVISILFGILRNTETFSFMAPIKI